MPRREAPCGPADVLDTRGFILTGRIDDRELRAALDAAISSPAFDGSTDRTARSGRYGPVAVGPATVAKAQHREHERLGSAVWFASLADKANVPVPELLDCGTTGVALGGRWWIVLRRVAGQESKRPTPGRLHRLGAVLRAWHEQAPLYGLALDDPGGLGVYLGTSRRFYPQVYPELSALLSTSCLSQPMTAVHGDVAIGHNALYQGEELEAVLDPGAVHIAPPMLDLAWCLAVDLPRGATAAPLLDSYGRDVVDTAALDALLPAVLLRRLLDCCLLGNHTDAVWLAGELRRRAPGLLTLPGVPPLPG